MPACNGQCYNKYCISDLEAHNAMAKHPGLIEQYESKSQLIREAIKTLVHADAGLTQLHWVEILSLMKKFCEDVAILQHTSFRNVAAPAEMVEDMLLNFDRGIWCLKQLMWIQDTPPVQDFRELMAQMPPDFAHSIGSQHRTSHFPVHFQNLQPQITATQASMPAPRLNIAFPGRVLPPRRRKPSSSQTECVPHVSPQIAVGEPPVGSQHDFGIEPASSQSSTIPCGDAEGMAAHPSTSESIGISSSRRRREPDACSMCKLKKTGCGGRFKHCLKNPANVKSPTATPIRETPQHEKLKGRSAIFPAITMQEPASNGELSQQLLPSDRLLPTAKFSITTNFERNISADGRTSLAIGAEFGLQHAHNYPDAITADAQESTNMFATPNPWGEWFDEIGNRTDYALDRGYQNEMSGY
jgi:hypothetical protein